MYIINLGNGTFEVPFSPEDQGENLIRICPYLKNEIIAFGDQGISNLPAPSLTNAVHPIFKQSRWVHGPGQMVDRLYRRLRPAFQMASLLITRESAIRKYWPYILPGKRVHVPSSGGSYDHVLRHPYEKTPEAREWVSNYFLAMSRNAAFIFLEHTNPPHSKLERAYGLTSSTLKCKYFTVPMTPPYHCRSVKLGRPHPTIGMNANFYDFFAYKYLKASY
jgi:hypothetical protein